MDGRNVDALRGKRVERVVRQRATEARQILGVLRQRGRRGGVEVVELAEEGEGVEGKGGPLRLQLDDGLHGAQDLEEGPGGEGEAVEEEDHARGVRRDARELHQRLVELLQGEQGDRLRRKRR